MFPKLLAIAFILSSLACAIPTSQARQDPCQDTYKTCVAGGTPEVACACRLTACLGEDNARNRDWCASATASLSLAKPTASTPSTVSAPITTAAPAADPVLVLPPKSWTIANLTRYCGEGNIGCDYNFAVTADNKTERCTIIRIPGSNAATESWSDQECTAGSDLTISWGYVTERAPAYAVITVVKGGELAWFGVPDVNGQKVMPGNPYGSGQWGTLGSSSVYTYT